MDAKLIVLLDSVEDKMQFKTATMRHGTNPSKVVRMLIKKWIKEHPIANASANMIG